MSDTTMNTTYTTPMVDESVPLLKGNKEHARADGWLTRFARPGAVVLGSTAVIAAVVAAVPSARASLATSLGHFYSNPDTWIPSSGNLLAPGSDGSQEPVTFTVHTYCKTEETKKNNAEFFMDGEKEAYVVHHDYGSGDFFQSENAVKMARVVLDENTGERGYRVTSSAADFEFGFAYKNVETGAWLYEIGGGSSSTMYNEPCVQQYGSYFNRVMTNEPNPLAVEYVYGTCAKQCDPAYEDTANLVRSVDAVVPSDGSELVVGTGDDARLFTLHSAKLGTWLRVGAQRDMNFPESEDEARFIVGNIDAYGPGLRWDAGRSYLLMSAVSVKKKSNGDIALSVTGSKYHKFDSQCSTVACSASVYDLGEKWNDDSRNTVWTNGGNTPDAAIVVNPLFTLGGKGDAHVSYGEVKFPDSAYMSDTTIAAAGTWGTDMDVRRLTFVSGAPCNSADMWKGTCIRNFHPIPDETVVATATEKVWIFATFGGNGCGSTAGDAVCISMVKVRVYLEDGALKAQVTDTSRHQGINAAERAAFSNYLLEMDVMNTPTPVGALFNEKKYSIAIQTSATEPGGPALGIGGFKYVMAPEMSPSLAAPNPRAGEAAVGARLGADLGDSAAEADATHKFIHDAYPGTTGCQTTCEGDDVDEDACGGKGLLCDWINGKCWSAVGSAECPADDLEKAAAVITSAEGCTTMCEHETQDQCEGDFDCIWGDGECFAQMIQPCPLA